MRYITNFGHLIEEQKLFLGVFSDDGNKRLLMFTPRGKNDFKIINTYRNIFEEGSIGEPPLGRVYKINLTKFDDLEDEFLKLHIDYALALGEEESLRRLQFRAATGPDPYSDISKNLGIQLSVASSKLETLYRLYDFSKIFREKEFLEIIDEPDYVDHGA